MAPRKFSRPHKQESEFEDKVLELRRVTRVVAGGKRFRFRATVVVGNGKGKIGIGVGKGLDVQQAIMKGKARANKAMVTIALKDKRTIPHETQAKYSAAQVLIKPAPEGHGLRAGSAIRAILTLAGIKDASAKAVGRTTNKLTNAWATLEALKAMKTAKPKVAAPVDAS